MAVLEKKKINKLVWLLYYISTQKLKEIFQSSSQFMRSDQDIVIKTVDAYKNSIS